MDLYTIHWTEQWVNAESLKLYFIIGKMVDEEKPKSANGVLKF